MLRLLFTSGLLRERLVNWEQVAAATLVRLQREALSTASLDELRTLIGDLAGDGALAGTTLVDLTRPAPLMLPLSFRVGEQSRSLFSTFTTLGTPLDVTLQELRDRRRLSSIRCRERREAGGDRSNPPGSGYDQRAREVNACRLR